MQQIQVKALCVFYTRGKILVSRVDDPIKNTRYYRPLGGHVEFGESSSDTIAREIKEELQADIANLRLIGTLENLFTFKGNPGHEIIQVYDAGFVDKSIYLMSSIPFTESNGQQDEAVWKSLDAFNESASLVPTGLLGLLKAIY